MGEHKAKIFLADERGLDETDSYRSYYTFNCGSFFNPYKEAFDRLLFLNEETFAPQHKHQVKVERPTIVVWLPLIGATTYKNESGLETIVSPGQLAVVFLTENSSVEVSNPYEHDLINFLEIRYEAPAPTTDFYSQIFSFDVKSNTNALIPIIFPPHVAASSSLLNISIGRFDGRKEAFYKSKDSKSKLFVFIIQGAFEVQGRLLHPQDGLALWDGSEDIELEALSNEAIILLIEQIHE